MVDADRKRDLKKAAREAERQAFLKEMPIGAVSARNLFDMVGDSLEMDSCHDDLRHTLAACEVLGFSADSVLPWLRQQGAGCDCEVLANVEEHVESATGGRG